MRSLSAFVLFGAALRSFRNGNATVPALEPSTVANATPTNATKAPAPAAAAPANATKEPAPAAAAVTKEAPAAAAVTKAPAELVPKVEPAAAAAAAVEPAPAAANTTEDAPVVAASLAQHVANATGFSDHHEAEADPVPLVDEPPAKVEQVVDTPPPPTAQELEPSAADVYAKVNRMLNQKNREARLREAAEEAADETAPEQVEKAPEPVAEKAPAPVAEKAPEPVAEKAPEPVAEKAPEPVAEKAPEPVAEKVTAPVRKAAPMAVPKADLSVEEKREKEFPTDWMKRDVNFNVDKDVMAHREDSVEAEVAAQQTWNSKQGGQSWIQNKKALRGM